MKKGLRFAILLAALLITAVATAEDKLVVGGSGSLTDEIEDMAKAFMAKNPGETVEVRPESMSTTGGIEGVLCDVRALGLPAPQGLPRVADR